MRVCVLYSIAQHEGVSALQYQYHDSNATCASIVLSILPSLQAALTVALLQTGVFHCQLV